MTALGALEGVRVLDLGRIVAAPTCCFYLASLGAEVIRIERPGGDMGWRVPPFVDAGGDEHPTRADDRVSLAHLKRGRGKRSVVIDFRHPEGLALVRRLARTADVVVENFRPGVMDAMGLGHEALAAENPGLVYCAISGYGQEGERRFDQAMDMVIQAEAGLMARTGFADGPPTKSAITVGDQVPAVFAALSVVAALRERDRTGHGRFIDVAMFDVLSALLWDEPLDVYADDGRPLRVGNRDTRGAPVDAYRTKDGWVALVATDDRQWTALAPLIGRPELAVHDTLAARTAHADEINSAVAEWAADQGTEVAMKAFAEANLPAGVVRDPVGAATRGDVEARGLLDRLAPRTAPDRPSRFLGSRFPVAFDGVLPVGEPAEVLGASTHAVLHELGCGDDEVAALVAAGVVASGPTGGDAGAGSGGSVGAGRAQAGAAPAGAPVERPGGER